MKQIIRMLVGIAGAMAIGTPAISAQPDAGAFANPQRFESTDGAVLYRIVCQGCHMADGRGAAGAGAYPSLAGNPRLQAPAYALHVVKNGQRAMPEFGSQLNDEQIAAVVKYVGAHFGNQVPGDVTAADVQSVTLPPRQEVPQWTEVSPHVYMRYQRTGTGRTPVVLLHALGSSLENMDELVPMLAAHDRTILRYDQRGSGMSTKIREHVTMDVWVEDLLALLDKLGLKEPAVLVGDTFGASIALQFAASHPGRTAGVVALSPTGGLAPDLARVARYPDPLAPGAAPATLVHDRTDVDPNDPRSEQKARMGMLENMYPEALRGVADPRRVERYFGSALSTDPTSHVLTLRAVYSVGFQDVYARVRAPVVMTVGRLFVRPVAAVKTLADAVPNARFVVLDTGHHSSVQTPELVGPLVQDFLKELGR